MPRTRRIKTLWATAALLSLPAAAGAQGAPSSSVQLYGQITAGAVYLGNQAGNTSVKKLDNSQFAASLFGLRGTEDLGGGMSAMFRIESGINADTGASGAAVGAVTKFWNRQSFVGLSYGPIATLTLGRQFHAATDRVIQSLDVYNVGGTTLAVTPLALFGVNKFNGNDSRADDSVKLRLRGPAGLTGALSAAFDDGAGRSYSFDFAQVTPKYAVGAYGVQFRSPVRTANGSIPEHAAYGVGGNLLAGPVRLYLHHMVATLDPSLVGRVEWKTKVTHLGANWQVLPQVSIKAALYHDKGTAINGVNGRNGTKDTTVVSADYFFSKRTSVHAGWFSNKFKDGYRLDPTNIAALGRDTSASSADGFTVGVRHDF